MPQFTGLGERALSTRSCSSRVAVAREVSVTDPQFLAEAEKLDLPVSGPIRGVEAEKIIASIYAAPPALIAHAREIVDR